MEYEIAKTIYMCATGNTECNAFSEFNAFSAVLSEFKTQFQEKKALNDTPQDTISPFK